MNESISSHLWLAVLMGVTMGCHDTVPAESRFEHLKQRVHQLEIALKECKNKCNQCMEAQNTTMEAKLDQLIETMQKTQSPKASPPVPLKEPGQWTTPPASDTPQNQTSPASSKPSTTAASETVGVTLSRSDVADSINRLKRTVATCGFQKGAVITFDITISPTGMVSEVVPLAPYTHTHKGDCAAKPIYGLHFAQTPKPTHITHAFRF